MLENKTVKKGPLIKKNVPHYTENQVVYNNAVKKENITALKGIGSQLTLIMTVVEQLGDQYALDTVEFNQLKSLLSNIKQELDK